MNRRERRAAKSRERSAPKTPNYVSELFGPRGTSDLPNRLEAGAPPKNGTVTASITGTIMHGNKYNFTLGVGTKIRLSDVRVESTKYEYAELSSSADPLRSQVLVSEAHRATFSLQRDRGREEKLGEQRLHAEQVAIQLQIATGQSYKVVSEQEGEEGVRGDILADALLVAVPSDSAPNVPLQMRHVLHQESLRSLGADGMSFEAVVDRSTIDAAISEKAEVDGREKYDLVLHCPADLGAPLRTGFASRHFDRKGWARVWLSDASGEACVVG